MTILEATKNVILTWMVAENVLKGVVDDGDRIREALCEKAEFHFQNSQAFRAGVLQKDRRGLEYLQMMMQHWFDAKFYLRIGIPEPMTIIQAATKWENENKKEVVNK